jgi:hypothetical protein
MRSQTSSSLKMFCSGPSGNVPGSLTYVDVPGIKGAIKGAGLLICRADIVATLSSAPLYDLYFRWLIDGIAQDAADYHAFFNVPTSTFMGFSQYRSVSAGKRVGGGLHSVLLQWKTDAAGTNNALSAFVATAEFQ